MPGTINSQIVETLLEHSALRFNGTIANTAASTLVMTASSPYMTVYNGTVAAQLVNLPNATTLSNGHTFQFWNNSTVSFDVRNNGGVSQQVVLPRNRLTTILIDNSTANGVWILEITSATNGGIINVPCSYTAAANVGRYLEFYPSNSSDLGPFLSVTDSIIVALAVVSNASTTGTVSFFKTTDLVNAITSISLTAQSSNSITGLNVPLVTGDKIAVRVTSGSIQKPGVSMYVLS